MDNKQTGADSVRDKHVVYNYRMLQKLVRRIDLRSRISESEVLSEISIRLYNKYRMSQKLVVTLI